MTKSHLEKLLGKTITSIQALSGGDIAKVVKVETKHQTYFVKWLQSTSAKEMFKQEVLGLQTLQKSKTIGIPPIVGHYSLDGVSYLILHFVPSKPPKSKNMERLGRELAALHLSSRTSFFGFETNNFTGTLQQHNTKHEAWPMFYVKERLLPQLKLAQKFNLLENAEIPTELKLVERCHQLLDQVSPALLHGDFWSGNYLISTNDKPYLIDPAVYFGHNEIDLAMSKLFGGFTEEFYKAYHEIIPPHYNQIELTEIYQLYYLLVHLNLFGASYRNGVVQILKKYFT